jgi:hypothetical protein
LNDSPVVGIRRELHQPCPPRLTSNSRQTGSARTTGSPSRSRAAARRSAVATTSSISSRRASWATRWSRRRRCLSASCAAKPTSGSAASSLRRAESRHPRGVARRPTRTWCPPRERQADRQNSGDCLGIRRMSPDCPRP